MKNNIIYIVGGILSVGLIFWISQASSAPGKLDAFASCLDEKGVTFYGAFWCPHCASQQALFGKSAKLLPYVECSTPDGQGQLAACRDKNITNYPTWEFPPAVGTTSMSRITGEVTLAQLTEMSGCPLPEGTI